VSCREAAANQSDDLRAVGVSREAGAGGTILKVKIFLRYVSGLLCKDFNVYKGFYVYEEGGWRR